MEVVDNTATLESDSMVAAAKEWGYMADILDRADNKSY